MRATNIEYHAPARFDDLVEVFIRVQRIGRTSVTYELAAYRVDDDVLIVTAHQTLVLVDLEERKACPVPDGVPDADRRVRRRRRRALTDPWPGEGIAAGKLRELRRPGNPSSEVTGRRRLALSPVLSL